MHSKSTKIWYLQLCGYARLDNERISFASSQKLKGKDGVGLRLPYWMGIILGYTADFMSYVSHKNLPVSSIRVKKFVSSTEFRSTKKTLETLNYFEAPFQLNEGVQRTLQSEFISPDPSAEFFLTE